MAFAYTVRSELEDDDTARQWRDWLCTTHFADVLKAGARSAQLVQLEPRVFESRYLFESRAEYERYIAEQSPRLRELTAKRFPPGCGLALSRSAGEVIYSTL